MSRVSRTAELDGLRAFAVWSVMLFHAGAPALSWGWLGVDIFFVLSGFLITTILLNEKERSGAINVPNFLYRRALRLLPAYFLYLFGISLFFILSGAVITNRFGGDWTEALLLLSLWTYTANYLPPDTSWEFHHLIHHLWSLSIEQQFYLILPLSLVLFPGLGGVSIRIGLLGVFFAVGTLADLFPGRANFTLTWRGLSLIVGCLAASVAFQSRGTIAKWRAQFSLFHQLAIVGTVLALLIIIYQTEVRGFSQGQVLLSSAPLLWIGFSIVIAGYWYSWSQTLSGLLLNRILLATGTISYGMYLYHMLCWHITFEELFVGEVTGFGRVPDYGLKLVVYFSLTYVLAAISYRWIELPFLRKKS